MIRLIHRRDLNEDKYNSCVLSSQYSNVYALSWYLDVVCDEWSVLVKDDYQAVMPLPWKARLGLRYITQPFFCQQLGIFSLHRIDNETIRSFLNSIPKRFIKVVLNVNFKTDSSKFAERINYMLNLNKDYETLRKNFRKDRKKSLRKAEEAKVYHKDFDNRDELISLYKETFQELHHPIALYRTINNIIDISISKKMGFIRNVYFNDVLISSGFFLVYNSRIYYLFAATNDMGKKYGATTYLIDSVIRDHSNSETIFDFEGSSIENIASFYKSFGSTKTSYYQYKSGII